MKNKARASGLFADWPRGPRISRLVRILLLPRQYETFEPAERPSKAGRRVRERSSTTRRRSSRTT